MLYFHDTYCDIEVFQDKSLLKMTWLRQPGLQEFQACFAIGLDLAARFDVHFWLSDNSKGINLDLAMQRFVAEHGARHLDNLSVVRFARVVPLDVFHEIVFRKMQDRFCSLTNNAIQFELFGNVELACAWLLQDESYTAIA